MFGKLMSKGAKNAPEGSPSEKHALDEFGQVVSDAAANGSRKNKKGVLDMVDRFMVRVIAPEVKRQYEQYSDHGDRHSDGDDQSYNRHSYDSHDRRDDQSDGYQPSREHYSPYEPRDVEEDVHEPYADRGLVDTQSQNQSHAPYVIRTRSQGTTQGHANGSHPPRAAEQTAPPQPSRPHKQVTTSRPHAKPRRPTPKHPSSLFRDPPSSPIQIFCDEVAGNMRGIGCHHPTFQYSNCTGRKKALCIGINYIGQKNELHGCIDDAHDIRNFLIRRYHYRPENVMILTDDLPDRTQHPTRQNMINAMHWLVEGAKCHDSLFFHYSGHGGQVTGSDVDPEKGYDDVIFPVDYQQTSHIVDSDLNNYLVHSLPQGCRLTSLFDSCHSGTVLDLPYQYHSNGRLVGKNISPHWRASKASSADAISWCACKDDQTSADTQEHGESVGAMSWAFRTALTKNPNQSYAQLLKSVRQILRNRYSQKSQLSSSHPMDIKIRFIM
jgi:hypothetical protein